MAEDMGERTEDPTPRRLSEARERGEIPKSADLTAAIELIGVTALLGFTGYFLWDALGGLLKRSLGADLALGGVEGDATAPMFEALRSAAVAAGPMLIGAVLVTAAAHLLQVGLVWTTQPLEPKFSRLNPITGLQRLLSVRGAIKTSTGVLKVTLVLLIGWKIVTRDLPRIAALPELGLAGGIKVIGQLGLELAIWLLSVLLLIGAADYFYQRWQQKRDLRMTKQEVIEERKSMDGDPHIKGRRMKMAREIAAQRTRSAVPKADVIVTNPTHFSVAIRYDQDEMRAPRVVAKGADHMAMEIRQLARTHGVPILERPPLARALYYGVKVGQEVPPAHYEAVAEILAYVYRLRERAAKVGA